MNARPEKLMARVLVDVAALTADWVAKNEAWHSHDHCQSCAFKEVHRERVGFFPNVAESITSVCALGKHGERPGQCPALVAERMEAMEAHE